MKVDISEKSEPKHSSFWFKLYFFCIQDGNGNRNKCYIANFLFLEELQSSVSENG